MITIAEAGTKPTFPLTSGDSVPGRPAIQAPPITRNMMAENIYMEPRVAMMGGTFSLAVTTPLTAPSSAPVARPSGATA